jgi:predicted nucleotidyltransferase
MLQKYNKLKVLNVFFEDPTKKDFQLREISRKINLAPPSVKNYLNELIKENLVLKIKNKDYYVYSANRDEEHFKYLKKINNIFLIKKTGLLEYLNETCMPDVIVLFGSASRGEDILDSDIDLFLLCKEKELNMKKYEAIFKRKINIFFSNNFNKHSKELRNNIINGIILSGYLKVF